MIPIASDFHTGRRVHLLVTHLTKKWILSSWYKLSIPDRHIENNYNNLIDAKTEVRPRWCSNTEEEVVNCF